MNCNYDDHDDVYIEHLPGLTGITVQIYIPGGESIYKVNHGTLDENQQNTARKVKSPFRINKLITYFQVKDAETGELIYEFDPPLKKQIKYTAQAWAEAVNSETGKELGRPRLAYLVWKNDSWADHWVEFTDEEINQVIPPGTNGDPHGYLCLTIYELEDPLIGGC